MSLVPVGQLLDVGGLSTKTDAAYRVAIYEQCRAAKLNPDFVNACVALESGYRPNVQNAGGAPALGALQFWRDFWPDLARRAGFTGLPWDSLRTLSLADQVPFIVAYFLGTPVAGRSDLTAGDYYAATVLPALVGAPLTWVVGIKGSTDPLRTPSGANTGLSLGKIYEQNAGLDRNGDGQITLGEIEKLARGLYDAALELPPVPVYSVSPGPAPLSLVAGAGLLFFCQHCGERSSAVRVETGEVKP